VTFSGNSANYGGGIFCHNNSSPSLVNCILWNDAPEEIYFDDSFISNSIMIAYSDIQGDSAGIITNNNGTVYWEAGNIDTDPLFTNESSGDYTLQNGSPCIDAGTEFFIWQGDTLVNLSPSEYDGSAPDMGSLESEFTVGINNMGLDLPEKFSLLQNFPNPFNPVTTLRYDLPEDSQVSIMIYDIMGRKVKTLVNKSQNAGFKATIWDATNDLGQPVSAGIYLYKIQAGEFVQTRKMVLLK